MRLFTQGSSWFSSESAKKGAITHAGAGIDLDRDADVQEMLDKFGPVQLEQMEYNGLKCIGWWY